MESIHDVLRAVVAGLSKVGALAEPAVNEALQIIDASDPAVAEAVHVAETTLSDAETAELERLQAKQAAAAAAAAQPAPPLPPANPFPVAGAGYSQGT